MSKKYVMLTEDFETSDVLMESGFFLIVEQLDNGYLIENEPQFFKVQAEHFDVAHIELTEQNYEMALAILDEGISDALIRAVKETPNNEELTPILIGLQD